MSICIVEVSLNFDFTKFTTPDTEHTKLCIEQASPDKTFVKIYFSKYLFQFLKFPSFPQFKKGLKYLDKLDYANYEKCVSNFNFLGVPNKTFKVK